MRFVRIALAALVASACAGPALAQDAYPTKSVTLVVPFPPGGGTDTGARWIAQKLSERWGQPVVVDNKPGAAGMIGAELVSRAKPDGYTIMMTNAQVAAIGATPVGSTAEQFKSLIDSETQRYRKIIVEKNISATE